MPEARTLAIFLPFLGAFLVGLNYTLNEKAFGRINLITYIFVYCVASALIMLLLHFLTPLKLDFSPLTQKTGARLIAISIPASLAIPASWANAAARSVLERMGAAAAPAAPAGVHGCAAQAVGAPVRHLDRTALAELVDSMGVPGRSCRWILKY